MEKVRLVCPVLLCDIDDRVTGTKGIPLCPSHNKPLIPEKEKKSTSQRPNPRHTLNAQKKEAAVFSRGKSPRGPKPVDQKPQPKGVWGKPLEASVKSEDASLQNEPSLGILGRQRSKKLDSTLYDGGIEYGIDTVCQICRDTGQHLPLLCESVTTRDAATQVVGIIMKRHENPDVSSERRAGTHKRGATERNRGYMVGVLQFKNQLYVAISGEGSLPPDLKALITRDTSCIIVDGPADNKTAGGRKINPEKLGIRQTGGSKFFECAAPKLISYICAKNKNIKEWYMTEMWFGESDDYHKHGDPCESCMNCKFILPLMLCKHSGSVVPKDRK